MGRKIVFIYISLIISKSKYSLCRKTFLKDWYFFLKTASPKKKKNQINSKIKNWKGPDAQSKLI